MNPNNVLKITIEREFKSEADASAWLQRVVGADAPPTFTIQTMPPLPAREGFPPAPDVQPTPLQQPPEPEKKARKARADAGQTRGPNKATTGSAVSPAGNGAGSVPTTAATDGVGGGTSSPATTAPPLPAAAETAKPLTEADARAALKEVNGTKGLGMEACVGTLRAHGVDRITLLPKEQYGALIAYCRKLVDEHVAKGKK